MATKGLTRTDVPQALATAKGDDRVGARRNFFIAMRKGAQSASFKLRSWGPTGLQIQTGKMREWEILELIPLGLKENSRYVWALVEKDFVPGVGLSSCDLLDDDKISSFELTSAQVHFLNWTCTWFSRIDSFWEEGGTLETHDEFLRNCQEDPEVFYFDPSPPVKSASKG